VSSPPPAPIETGVRPIRSLVVDMVGRRKVNRKKTTRSSGLGWKSAFTGIGETDSFADFSDAPRTRPDRPLAAQNRHLAGFADCPVASTCKGPISPNGAEWLGYVLSGLLAGLALLGLIIAPFFCRISLAIFFDLFL